MIGENKIKTTFLHCRLKVGARRHALHRAIDTAIEQSRVNQFRVERIVFEMENVEGLHCVNKSGVWSQEQFLVVLRKQCWDSENKPVFNSLSQMSSITF